MLSSTDKHQFLIDGGFYINGAKDHFGIGEHTHDFAEFSYVFSGKCVHTIDGVDYPTQKGDLIFINYGSVHSVKTKDKVNYADILIKPEYIDESLAGTENAFSLLRLDDFKKFDEIINKENSLVHFQGEDREKIEMLISWLTDEQNKTLPGNSLVKKSAINLFLTMVFRKMALPMYKEDGISRELLQYIKENSRFNLSMSEAAKMCGYNSAYFSRLFKKNMGVNFTEYILDLRLWDAMEMLKNTDKPIEEIIGITGFSDRTKFFKKFYEKTKMTPKEFRKSKKQIL